MAGAEGRNDSMAGVLVLVFRFRLANSTVI